MNLKHVVFALVAYELFIRPKAPAPRGDVQIGDVELRGNPGEWLDYPKPARQVLG